ncbi:hypothetical protein [Erythrobacter sp. YT30]|uniref:hypothetical protein n=1 Tax=Erythrobacter sp. YT30 TaxID=1735012 RepID=UPI0012E3D95D|nr:hypothetical protein [Erythrobacter sp. YT30]
MVVALTIDQPGIAFPNESGCWAENESPGCPLIITQEGTLIHRGEQITASEVVAIESAWEQLGYPVLGVTAHPLAEYQMVAKHLAEFDKALPIPASDVEAGLPRFALVEMEERYSKIGAERDLAASYELLGSDVNGDAVPYTISIFVGHSNTTNACVFMLGGLSLSAEELSDQSFRELDELVQRAGAAASSPDFADRLVAKIQSDAETPWKCVAGAMFQVKRSGWPSVNLEVYRDRSATNEHAKT